VKPARKPVGPRTRKRVPRRRTRRSAARNSAGFPQTVSDDPAAGLPAEAGGAGLVGVHHEEAVRGDDGKEPSEGVLHRLEIGKMSAWSNSTLVSTTPQGW